MKPPNATIRALLIEALTAAGVDLTRAPCGDNSCMFGPLGGMGTNGGCRCWDRLRLDEIEARQVIRGLARAVRELATRLAEAIDATGPNEWAETWRAGK